LCWFWRLILLARKRFTPELDTSLEAAKERLASLARDPACFISKKQIEQDERIVREAEKAGDRK
jgi:hypothetical protein